MNWKVNRILKRSLSYLQIPPLSVNSIGELIILWLIRIRDRMLKVWTGSEKTVKISFDYDGVDCFKT